MTKTNCTLCPAGSSEWPQCEGTAAAFLPLWPTSTPLATFHSCCSLALADEGPRCFSFSLFLATCQYRQCVPVHTAVHGLHKEGNGSNNSHSGPNVKRLRILMICLRSGSFALSAYSGCCHLCGTISNSANAWLTFERDTVYQGCWRGADKESKLASQSSWPIDRAMQAN